MCISKLKMISNQLAMKLGKKKLSGGLLISLEFRTIQQIQKLFHSCKKENAANCFSRILSQKELIKYIK